MSYVIWTTPSAPELRYAGEQAHRPPTDRSADETPQTPPLVLPWTPGGRLLPAAGADDSESRRHRGRVTSRAMEADRPAPASLVAVTSSRNRTRPVSQGSCALELPGGPGLRSEAIVGGPAAGDGSGLDLAVRVELVQDAPYVAAQGAHRDVHFAGHLPGALARDDPLQNLPLPRREPLQQLLHRRRHRASA